jgi:hypothetical protein
MLSYAECLPLKRISLVAALSLFAVVTLVSSPGFSRAQDNAVKLSVEAGYEGYFRGGQWLPVLVSVSNDGADISGELRVFAPDLFGGGSDTYATTIDLPTRSSKQVYLYIPLSDQITQLRVELATRERLVTSQIVDIRLMRESDMLFAVITESPRGGIDLKAIRSGVGDAFQANWRIDNVPRISDALRGLDALILTDADTGVLATEQRSALRDWVLGGGHLVVTGGPNWQRTQAGVGDLLPIQATGTTTLTSLPDIARFAGKPGAMLNAPASAPIIVATGTLGPNAEVLAAQSNVPLVIRHAVGGGIVDYVAVDPGLEPMLSWADRGQFWFTLLTTTSPRPSWAGGIKSTDAATIAANQVAGLRLPDVVQLIGFLIVYILIIGPVNYVILRQIGKREWAWATIPIIVIVTALIYFVTGFNLRGTQAIVNRLALVQVWPGTDRAQVDGVVGVAAPRRGVYDLALGAGLTLRSLSNTGLTIYESAKYQALGFPVDAGTTASFTTSGYTTAVNIDGEATIQLGEGSALPTPTNTSNASARITGTVRNTTGLTLKNVTVLALGGAFELGTLDPGETRNFSMPMRADQSPPVTLGNGGVSNFYLSTGVRGGAARNFGPDMTVRNIMGSNFTVGRAFVGRGLENTADRQEMVRRQRFLEAISSDTDPSGGRGTNVYVLGWVETSPLEVELAGAPFITEDTTLYVYQLPVKVGTLSPTGIVELPNAYMTWTPTEQSARRDVSPYDLRLNPAEKIAFRFTPMPLMQLREITEIRLTLKPGNSISTGRGTLSLWDWTTNQWEAFSTTNFLTRIRQDQNPARFIGPENAIDVLFDAGDSQNTVYYERLDITLYGRLGQNN